MPQVSWTQETRALDADTPDFYALLGVATTASEAEIRSAFRKLATKNHPDRNPNDDDALVRFKAINTAYQILSNPESRAVYDRYCREGYGLDLLRGYRTPTPTPTGPPPAPSARPSSSNPVPPRSDPASDPASDPGSDPWIQSPVSSERGAPGRRLGVILGAAVAVIVVGGIVTMVAVLRAERQGAAATEAAVSASASAVANGPKLSSDDEMTLRMACSKLQMKGDIQGYKRCREDFVKLAASVDAPSFEGVPPARVMQVKVACDEFQMRGDVLAHRQCIKDKLAAP